MCFDSEKACRPHLAAQSTTTATSDPNCHCKKVHTERTSPVSTIKEKHQAPHPTRHHHHGWDHDRKPHGMTSSTGPRHTKSRGHKALSPQTPPQCHHLLFSRSQRTQHTPQRYHATATAKSITPNTTMDASLAQTPPPTTASTTQTPSHPNLSSTQQSPCQTLSQQQVTITSSANSQQRPSPPKLLKQTLTRHLALHLCLFIQGSWGNLNPE